MNDLFEFLKEHPRLSSCVIYARSTGERITYRVFTEDDVLVYIGYTTLDQDHK